VGAADRCLGAVAAASDRTGAPAQQQHALHVQTLPVREFERRKDGGRTPTGVVELSDDLRLDRTAERVQQPLRRLAGALVGHAISDPELESLGALGAHLEADELPDEGRPSTPGRLQLHPGPGRLKVRFLGGAQGLVVGAAASARSRPRRNFIAVQRRGARHEPPLVQRQLQLLVELDVDGRQVVELLRQADAARGRGQRQGQRVQPLALYGALAREAPRVQQPVERRREVDCDVHERR